MTKETAPPLPPKIHPIVIRNWSSFPYQRNQLQEEFIINPATVPCHQKKSRKEEITNNQQSMMKSKTMIKIVKPLLQELTKISIQQLPTIIHLL